MVGRVRSPVVNRRSSSCHKMHMLFGDPIHNKKIKRATIWQGPAHLGREFSQPTWLCVCGPFSADGAKVQAWRAWAFPAGPGGHASCTCRLNAKNQNFPSCPEIQVFVKRTQRCSGVRERAPCSEWRLKADTGLVSTCLSQNSTDLSWCFHHEVKELVFKESAVIIEKWHVGAPISKTFSSC